MKFTFFNVRQLLGGIAYNIKFYIGRTQ